MTMEVEVMMVEVATTVAGSRPRSMGGLAICCGIIHVSIATILSPAPRLNRSLVTSEDLPP